MPDMDANDFLLSSGVRSAKFANPKDSVTGFISRPPEVQHQRDFQSGDPVYWPDGKPKLQLKVVLMTEEQDPDDPEDSGERALYVKGQMQQAIAQAVRQAGAGGLEVGGKLRVTYVRNGQAKRGFNPPKVYEAQYRKSETPVNPEPNGVQQATEEVQAEDTVPF